MIHHVAKTDGEGAGAATSRNAGLWNSWDLQMAGRRGRRSDGRRDNVDTEIGEFFQRCAESADCKAARAIFGARCDKRAESINETGKGKGEGKAKTRESQ